MASSSEVKPSDPNFLNLPREVRIQTLEEILSGITVKAIPGPALEKPKRVLDPVIELQFFPLNSDPSNPFDPEGEWRRSYVPMYEADYAGSGINDLLSIHEQIRYELTDIIRWQTKVTFSFHSTVAMLDVLLGDLKFPSYRGPHLDLATSTAVDDTSSQSLVHLVRRIEVVGTPVPLYGAIPNDSRGFTTHFLKDMLEFLGHAGMKLDSLKVYDPYLPEDDGWGRRHMIWEMQSLIGISICKELSYIALEPYLQDSEVKELARTALLWKKQRSAKDIKFEWDLPTTPVRRTHKTGNIVGLFKDESEQIENDTQQNQSNSEEPETEVAYSSESEEQNLVDQSFKQRLQPSNDAIAGDVFQTQVFGHLKGELVANIVNTETGAPSILNLNSLTYNNVMSVTMGNLDKEEQQRCIEENNGVMPSDGPPLKDPSSGRIRSCGPLPGHFQVWPAKQEVAPEQIDPTFPAGSKRFIYATNVPIGPFPPDGSGAPLPQPQSVGYTETIPVRPKLSAREREAAKEEEQGMTRQEKYRRHRDKYGWGDDYYIVMRYSITNERDKTNNKNETEDQVMLSPVLNSLIERMTWKEVRESMDYLSSEGTQDVCSLL